MMPDGRAGRHSDMYVARFRKISRRKLYPGGRGICVICALAPAVIDGATDAARRRLEAGNIDPDKLIESLAKINAQAHRAGEIIRRLRHLVEKHDGQGEVAGLDALTRETANLAEPDARLHEVIIEPELLSESMPVVLDTVQTRQMLLNLIRNPMSKSYSTLSSRPSSRGSNAAKIRRLGRPSEFARGLYVHIPMASSAERHDTPGARNRLERVRLPGMSIRDRVAQSDAHVECIPE